MIRTPEGTAANGDVSQLTTQMVILLAAVFLSQLLPSLVTSDSTWWLYREMVDVSF